MSQFVGRDAERAVLVEALREPNAFVLVEGDAGMGKSRLVAESLQAPPLATLRVAAAECLPLTEPFPLGPLIELLHGQPLDELELSPLAGALRPLLPEWAAALPPAPEPLDEPPAVRHRVLRAMAEVVTKLRLDALVIEDVHWADPATLEFLLVLGAAPPEGLRLVLTCRPPDVPPDSPLRRITARSSARTTRVVLEPLDVAAAGQMAASMFESTEVAPAVVDLVHRRTDGVPLALQESLALLIDRGGVDCLGEEAARRAVADLEVPPTVRDSVIERVQRLDPPTRQVLAAAAVLREAADEPLLSRVAELPGAAIGPALAAALGSGLLRAVKADQFQFRHALAAQAVEESIPASERRRLHHAAARAVGELPSPQPARLVRHFREANDVQAWSAATEAAADLALAAGDDRSAIRLLLDLAGHPEQQPRRRLRLARRLGDAAAWGVDGLGELGERVVDVLRDILAPAAGGAADLADLADLAEIRLLLGRMLLQLGEFDAAAEQTELALPPLTGRPALAARAMMSLSWPRGRAWSASRHAEWLERAAELVEQVRDPADRIVLEVDHASVGLMLGRQSAWSAPDRLRPHATSLVERRQWARLLMNAGHVGIAWGRDAEARRRLDEAAAVMAETQYRRLLNSARLTTAHLDWLAGEWDGLAGRIRGLAAAEETLPEARLEAQGTLALLEVVRGDRALAARELRAVLADAVRRGVADGQFSPAAALGRLALADGDVDQALAITSDSLETVVCKGMWLWAGAVVTTRLDALVAAGLLAEADELVAAFEAGIASAHEVPAPRAFLALGQGTVAQAHKLSGVAVTRFAGAARAWARLPRPYSALLALERQALAELAAGDDDTALTRLAGVQTGLSERGAAWDADRVARLLRDHGVGVARAWRGGRRGYGDELSPRERQVAELVAQGLTNRQVAQDLFLSPRTVDRHLGSAMRKLGVTTRTALAVAFHDRKTG